MIGKFSLATCFFVSLRGECGKITRAQAEEQKPYNEVSTVHTTFFILFTSLSLCLKLIEQQSLMLDYISETTIGSVVIVIVYV